MESQVQELENICIITRSFPPRIGGAETYAYEIANNLADIGFNVDVYTQWVNHPDETVDTHEKVDVYRISKSKKSLSIFSTLHFSFKSRRRIDFGKYDIIHGILMPASTIALTPLNDIYAPLVLTSHGTSIDEAMSVKLTNPADYLLKFFFHPMNVVFDFIASWDADAVIAISDDSYNKLKSYYNIEESRLHMIPHGVNTEKFYPRENTDPHHEGRTILYVGRLGTRKGVDLLLKTVERMDSKDVKLLIAGTGRYEEELKQLTEELDIKDLVEFLGYVPDEDLPNLYSSADVFVLPSRYEGFGLVLLESMACGTPVIGTAVGGIPTVIDQGDNGYIVPRDSNRLSERLDEVLLNDDLRHRLGESAYSKANSLDWKDIANRTTKLYARLVK